MGTEEWIAWKKINGSIQKKIEDIREQEEEIDDPVVMSFLQVHEEILHDIKDDLREYKVSDPPQD